MNRYLVITTRTHKFQEHVLEPHRHYLEILRFNSQLVLAGPFKNKPGGAYMIWANDLESATSMAQQDPIYTSESAKIAVYEWEAS